MVSIVTGSGAGLVNSSKDVLGRAGEIGNPTSGRAGERVTVNAATGNLVVQDRDEYLVGIGADVDLLRTYNSQGGWDGDNGDGWRIGYYRWVSGLSGTVNTAGSNVKRTDADGHEALYTFDAGSGKYLTSEGSGQFDSLSFGTGVWTWTDGDTGTTETYATANSGQTYRLTQVKDPAGHLVKVDYDGANLISALSTFKAGSSTADEVVTLNYSGTQLTKITTSYKDAQGALKTRSVTSYGYDNGRLSQVTTDLTPEDSTDNSTYTVKYGYDANGRLQTLTQKDGSRQFVEYWGDGSVKSITEQTVTEYMPDGSVKTVRDDRKTGFVYDTVNRTTTVTDALNQVTTLKYLSGLNGGQLEEIKGALVGGATFKQSYTYDNGDVLTSTNAKGEVTTYEYVGNGKLSRRTDAAGNVLERTYTSEGLLSSETVYVVPDLDGPLQPGKASVPRTTQYIYDTTQIAKRRLAYVLGPQGEVTRYTYNAEGQVQRRVQYTGALFTAASPTFTSLEDWVNGPQKLTLDRQVTEFTYDLRGQVQEERHYASETLSGSTVVDGDATKTTTTYDAFGRLLASKNTDGKGTTYLYDGLNRLTQSVDANSAITLYTYDDTNRKTSVKLDNGLTTVQVFDAMGRLVSSDVLGAASQVALGATKYFYDAVGQLRRVQDATGVSVYSLYDVSGRKSADIAANGQLTEYLYDGAGRLVQTVAYATLVSATTLATLSDSQGQPTAKTVANVRPAVDDNNDRITTFYYDAAGRPAGTRDADGYLTQNQYDGTSALTAQTRFSNAVGVTRLDATLGTTRTSGPSMPAPTQDAVRDRTTRNLYDASGRLGARVDGDGGLTVWKYDAAGNMVSQLRRSQPLSDADRTGGTLATLAALTPLADDEFTQWIYDGVGRQVAMLNAEGYLTEFKFDTVGRAAGENRYLSQAFKPVVAGSPVSLRLFKTTDLTPALRTSLSSPKAPLSTGKSYNSRGLLETETAVDGTVTFYDYDNLQRLKSTTLAQNTSDERKRTIGYDDWGRVQTTQVQGDATVVTTTYDAAGRRLSVKDARGNTTFYYYDAQGRQVYAILRDPILGGEVTETVYSNFNEVQLTVTHARRLSTSDSAWLVGGKIDGTAVASTLTWVLPDATADNRSTVSYNRRGLIQQAIDALGYKTDYSYNAFGQVSKQIYDVDAKGTANARRLTVDFGYDRRGDLTRTERSGTGLGSSVVTSSVFDALGRLDNTKDELERTTRYTYLRDIGDGTGRKVTIAGSAGAASTTYDALDRVLTRVDRNSNTVTYTHDAGARKLTIKTAEGIQTTTEYTRLGQAYKLTDGAGATTTYAYDTHGNLTTVTDALGNVTQNGYDANDNLVKVIGGLKANGSGAPISGDATTTTTYSFDAANRVLTQTVDPLINGVGLNLQTRYEYDGQGRKLKITDPRGTVTTQVFNVRGEITDVIVDDSVTGLKLKTSYAYDAQRRVLTVTEGVGTPSARKTAYTYDILGRRLSETVDPDGIKLKTGYEYDAAGRLLVKRDTLNNVAARYSYDGADRIRYAVDALGIVTRYDYDGEGRVNTAWNYSTRLSSGWETKTDDELRAALDALGSAAADRFIVNAYDKDGRLIYAVDALGQVTERAYDGAGRVALVRQYDQRMADVAAGMSTVAIDVKVASLRADAKNHVTRYAYDKAGNQRFVVDAEGYVKESRYDATGRIVARVEHEQAWGASVGTVPTEAELIAAYSPTKTEFNVDLEGVGGAVGVWEAGRFKLISEPVGGGGSVYTASKRTMPIGSVLKLEYQPMQVQQQSQIILKDGAGGLGRVALVFKKDGHVYTQRPQPGTSSIAEADLGAYTPGKTYCIEMDSTDTGARVFVYEKGTSITGALSATVTEPTMNWQSVQLELGVQRDSTLPVGQTISYVDNIEEIPPVKGRVTQFAYDAAGRPRFALDAEGYVTETRYGDANGRTTVLRYPNRVSGGNAYTPSTYAPSLNTFVAALPGLGTATSVTRELDRAGRLALQTDGNDIQTQFTYDAVGRLQTEIQASNVAGQSSTTRYVYNTAGQRTAVIRGDGTALASTTRYEYDSLGRLWHQIDPRGVALAEGAGTWEQYERARLGFYSYPVPDGDKAALLKVYTTEYAYDADNRVVKVTDPMGGVVQTEYDTFGNATVVTDARGYKRYQVYDKAGRLVQSVDAERYLTVYGYDAYGNLTGTTRVDAKVQGTLTAGQAVILASTAPGSGSYVLTNAANDHTVGRQFDRNNRLLKETDAENYTEGADSLDAFGQQLTVKNKRGATTTYTYDRLGHVLTETLPVQVKVGNTLRNVVNEYQYDSRGNRVLSIEAKGLTEERRTAMSYDGANRLIRRTGMSYTAVAADNTSSTVTPADTWRYDARGNVVEQIVSGQLQANGSVTGVKRAVSYYDALDRKILEVNPDRVVTSSQYDPAGNVLVQTVYATRLATNVTVDPATAPTPPTQDYLNDRTRRYRYDAMGRVVQVVLDYLYVWDSGDGTNLVISDLPLQQTTLQQYFYDAAGNLTESKNARGYSSYSYYDADGRKVMTIDEEGAVTSWEYGRAGGVATKETRYSGMLPGGYGRQASTAANTAPHNDPVQLRAFAASVANHVAADDRVTEYTLDRLNRVTEKRILGVTQDLIDADGTRSVSVDRVAKTAYSYDGLGHVTQVRELAAVQGQGQGQVETWETTDIGYDGLGREIKRQGVSFKDWEDETVRPTDETEYDGLSNVARRIQRGKKDTVETDDRFTSYGYDVNGLLIKMTDAVGAVTEYAYNGAGDLSRRTAKDVHRSDSTTATTKRDIVVRYERDAMGRVVAETSYESDKAIAAETRKTRYNAFGEVSGKGIGDGWEEFFEYSTLGKIIKTNTGTGAIKYYVYDAAGNQTREISIIGNNYNATWTLRDAATYTQYFSRVSVYNRRNQLVKTIDPTFYSIRSGDVIQDLYTQSWTTSWSPPSTGLISGGVLPTGTVVVNGSQITFTMPGAKYARFLPLNYEIYGQSGPPSDDGKFTFSLATPELKGKVAAQFSIRFYSSLEDIGYSSYGWTLGANGGALNVDADGKGTLVAATAPPYPMTAPAGITMPAQSGYDSTYYSFQVTDTTNGRSFSDGAVAYGPTSPGGSKPARIHFPASFQHGDATPHILEVRYVCYPSGNVATMRLSYSSSGELQYLSTQAQGVPSPIKLYIRGRNVPKAEVTIGNKKVLVAGTYTAPAGDVPGYTMFQVDPTSVGFTEGERFYTLRALDANSFDMIDEVGTAIRQEGKVVMTNYNLPAQVLRQQTLIQVGTTTVSRVQAFNAFGEVSEERDERVEQRMLAALNEDRVQNKLPALTALTADQKDAARTTLKYNTLGQLIAKIDPETFVTAENGYRYRARPETDYGYDLLGRHTTMTDANGNLSRVRYLAGSRGADAQVLKEFDAAGGNGSVFSSAAGGMRENKYDVFGNAVVAIDALGAITERRFDARDRLVQATRKNVQRLASGGSDALGVAADLSDFYTYDELGQRLTATNALNIKTRTDYDAQGHVVQTVSGNGFVTSYTYALLVVGQSDPSLGGIDSGGYFVTTVQSDGRTLKDKYNYFNRLTSHSNILGQWTAYSYNRAGQLMSAAGQSLVEYTYYANGYVSSVANRTAGIGAQYVYDDAGNRITESNYLLNISGQMDTTQTAEDTYTSQITYDELNRITRVKDLTASGAMGRFNISYEFDANGNRRLVDAIYSDGLGGFVDRQTYWYAYDKLNRFTFSKGQLNSTEAVRQGDDEFNRSRVAKARRATSILDTSISVVAGSEGIALGYDKNSQRTVADYTDTSGGSARLVHEVYGYSKDGYLQTTTQTIDGTARLIATRVLDVLGRTQVMADLVNHTATTTVYDKDNRLSSQSVDGDTLSTDTSKDYNLAYSYYAAIPVGGNPVVDVDGGASGAGALSSVTQTPAVMAGSASVTTTTYAYKYFDEAKQSVITRTQGNQVTKATLNYYGDGSILSHADETTGITKTYRIDADGQVIKRSYSSNGNTNSNTNHYYYYADGHRIGDVGNSPEDKVRISYAEQLARNGKAESPDARRERYMRPGVRTADFDQNYEPINDSYPGSAASSYTVRRDGETLRSIAQALWGDSSMWYLIAEANGLLTDSALKAGRVLLIPNKVSNIHNNSTTWRPYSAGEAIGRTDPNMPKIFDPGAYSKEEIAKSGRDFPLSSWTDWRKLNPTSPWANAPLWVQYSNYMSQTRPGYNAWQDRYGYVADISSQYTAYDTRYEDLSPRAQTEYTLKQEARQAWRDVMKVLQAQVDDASIGLGTTIGILQNLDWRGVGASGFGNAIGESLSEPSYKTLQDTGPGVERMERIDIGKLPDLAPIDIDRNLPRLDLSAAGGGLSSDYGYAGDDGQVPTGLANKPGVRFKDGVYPGGWQRSDGYGLSTPVLWRDKPGGKSWEEIPLEQLPRVVVTGKSEATRAREAWAQQSEPVWSFREASEARVAQDMAEYQARIDSGPQMSAITPEMDAAARAEAAQTEGLQNFLKAQGEGSISGPVSAAMYLATRDVVAASSAADAMAPIEGFWAPSGRATANRLASRTRTPAGGPDFVPYRNQTAPLSFSVETGMAGSRPTYRIFSNEFILNGRITVPSRANSNGAYQFIHGTFDTMSGDLYISKVYAENRRSGIGTELISRAVEHYGPENVKSITGELGSSNLDIYNKLVAQGVSPMDAALRTPAAAIRVKLGYSNISFDPVNKVIVGARP
ncbi:hypothetical protein ACS5PN_28040 [Roseateles sp. NT4]|uniref:hypothetical protein n=1 Tax=Roseateles sp. NT4 TaxID=3453715 RepID=UPI003EEFD1E4